MTIANNVVLHIPDCRTQGRVWPVDFTFPVHSLTNHLRQILSDPLLTLRKSELKDIVNALFTQMISITTLWVLFFCYENIFFYLSIFF